ncbi:MAG TPA: hypothetical protein VNL71_08915, partial [Chloroflexota bacterium]|nr:hypothetical protein [Chloroflexota bacterium]
MNARMYGRLEGRAIGVVGVWDPLTVTHRALFEQVRCQAARRGLSSLAVVIDPDPARFIWNREPWPVFNDVHTRGELLRALGIDAMLHLRFHKGDLAAGAREFFDQVGEHAELAELWLGAKQSLGRGPNGSQEMIAELAAERSISLHLLPSPAAEQTKISGAGAVHPIEVRKRLAEGRIEAAGMAVGCLPMRRRPRGATLRVAWAPGCYQALTLAQPAAPATGGTIEVDLVDRGNGWADLH